MSALRQSVVFCMILWLAIQASVVVAMPFCAHGDPDPTGNCHGGRHHTDVAGSATNPAHCDDCASCQLACAPALPAHGLNLQTRSRHSQPEHPFSALTSYSPERAHPPPVRLQR